MKKVTVTVIYLVVLLMIVGFFIIKFNNKDVQNSVNNSHNNEKNNITLNLIEYKMIGNNLYYTDDLIEKKAKKDDAENIKKYYEIISNYIETNYPGIQVYINNFNYDTINTKTNEISFNGYQIINSAIVANTLFTIELENNKVSDNLYFSNPNQGFNNRNNFNTSVNNIISIEKIRDISKELILAHLDEIGSTEITGDMFLEYTINNILTYKVCFNNGSYISLDALTGEVVDSYYFNGMYF